MSFNDSVADMLNRIMNGSRASHEVVEVRYSKLCVSILQVMQGEGFIAGFKARQDDYAIDVTLKYHEKIPVIKGVERNSRPGLRRYVKSDVPSVNGGLALIIVSTNKGVLPGWKADQENVGGEWLCTIY